MDDIIIEDYNPAWPQRYTQEAARITEALANTPFTRMEHIGSTAVPGLPAKPIIDLLIGVNSIDAARQTAVPALEAIGYAFWYDDPDPDHLFFVKGLPPNGPRSHHIHIVKSDSNDWDRVHFRNYLRASPEEAARYAALKRDLAVRFAGDREAYTVAKGAYIQEVTLKAKQYFKTSES
jgi:GrpB-like predicted nucleotidyltransferase (UPF0157 family)